MASCNAVLLFVIVLDLAVETITGASTSTPRKTTPQQCPNGFICCPGSFPNTNAGNRFQCCPGVGPYPKTSPCPTPSTTRKPAVSSTRCPTGSLCCPNSKPVQNTGNKLKCCPGIGPYDPSIEKCASETATNKLTTKATTRKCPTGYICCGNFPQVLNNGNKLKCCPSTGPYDPSKSPCPAR